MPELKSCPLCGMYGVSYETRQETGNKLLACEFCGLRIEARTFDEAEEAWNHRPLEDELAKALKELVRLKDLKEVDPEAHDAGKAAAWAAARAAVRRMGVEA